MSGPKVTNDARDEQIRVDRRAGMSFRELGLKYGITPQRAHLIVQGAPARSGHRTPEDHWQRQLSAGANSLLYAIIKLGLRRIYYPRAGEPDGIPDMPPDDIRARARELGLLR